MKKKQSLVRFFVLRWLFGLLYVSGLTFVFPLIFYYIVSIGGAAFPVLPSILAGILILISFFGMILLEENFSRALRSLSATTLIPGLVGIFISLFGKSIVFRYLSRGEAGERAVALLDIYLESAVPKIRILTVGYVLIGLLLFYLSRKFRQRR